MTSLAVMRAAVRLLITICMLFLLCSLLPAETITGTVSNGTTGKPACPGCARPDPGPCHQACQANETAKRRLVAPIVPHHSDHPVTFVTCATPAQG